MIIGLILAGTGFGAAAAFGAVLLGYPIWMALLIYVYFDCYRNTM